MSIMIVLSISSIRSQNYYSRFDDKFESDKIYTLHPKYHIPERKLEKHLSLGLLLDHSAAYQSIITKTHSSPLSPDSEKLKL